MSSSVDVVVVAYDSRDCIVRCVEAARRLEGVGRVVVVDHGRDGSGRLARAAGATVVGDPANPGFGAGQNRGVDETDAPFVLLLNPDAEPSSAGVAAGVRLLERAPSVAAVQGVIVGRASGRPERSQGRELGPLHLLGRALGARRLLGAAPVRWLARRVPSLADHVDRVPSSVQPVTSLAATALLVRARAFQDVGGFDERYFLYGEDLDLCRRLRAAGWVLMALPDEFAVHDGGASSGRWATRELAWWSGTMRFAASWWPERSWWAACAAASLAWVTLVIVEPSRARRAWRTVLTEPRAARRERPAGQLGALAPAQSSGAA